MKDLKSIQSGQKCWISFQQIAANRWALAIEFQAIATPDAKPVPL